eukprot:839504-Prymnesium_polylepis.1
MGEVPPLDEQLQLGARRLGIDGARLKLGAGRLAIGCCHVAGPSLVPLRAHEENTVDGTDVVGPPAAWHRQSLRYWTHLVLVCPLCLLYTSDAADDM